MSFVYGLFPVLFIIAAAVGVFILLAALRGLVNGTLLVPDLRKSSGGKTFVAVGGREAKIWIVLEIIVGLGLIVIMLFGMGLYSDFRNSPARIDSLLTPPAEKQVLHYAVDETSMEAIYIFDIDSATVRNHYLHELESKGWTISGKPGAALIFAEKDDMKLEMVIIGSQPADNKDFACKLIISLNFR